MYIYIHINIHLDALPETDVIDDLWVNTQLSSTWGGAKARLPAAEAPVMAHSGGHQLPQVDPAWFSSLFM